jgi:hypothetical protein
MSSSLAEAKVQLRAAIHDAARAGRPMSYSDAAKAVTSQPVTPRSPTMSGLLRAILVEDHAQTGLLITAVVVRREDGMPGVGFFQAARKLGYQGTQDRYAFWDARRREVFAHFSTEHSQPA